MAAQPHLIVENSKTCTPLRETRDRKLSHEACKDEFWVNFQSRTFVLIRFFTYTYTVRINSYVCEIVVLFPTYLILRAVFGNALRVVPGGRRGKPFQTCWLGSGRDQRLLERVAALTSSFFSGGSGR